MSIMEFCAPLKLRPWPMPPCPALNTVLHNTYHNKYNNETVACFERKCSPCSVIRFADLFAFNIDNAPESTLVRFPFSLSKIQSKIFSFRRTSGVCLFCFFST